MTLRLLQVAAVTLLCACPPPARAAEPADHEAEQRELRKANETLTRQVAELQALVETLRAEITDLKRENARIAAASETLEEQQAELKARADAAAEADPDAAAQSERLTSVYEEDGDRTVTTFGPEPVDAEGSPGAFHFSVVFAHPGRASAPTDQATLFIQTSRAGRVFHGREAARFEIDDEALTLPIDDVRVNDRRFGRSRSDRSDETVRLPVDRATLMRLGRSRSLVLREGRTLVTFDRDDRAALRAAALRMGGE